MTLHRKIRFIFLSKYLPVQFLGNVKFVLNLYARHFHAVFPKHAAMARNSCGSFKDWRIYLSGSLVYN